MATLSITSPSRLKFGRQVGNERGVEDQLQALVERQMLGDDVYLSLVQSAHAQELHVG